MTAEWTGGPTGPDDKQLNRPWICAATSCPVYTSLRARDEEEKEEEEEEEEEELV